MEPQTAALSTRAAYDFGTAKGLKQQVEEIRNMEIEWERRTNSSVRRGYLVDLFEKNGIFEEFKAKHWANGNTSKGERLRKWYLNLKQQYEDWLGKSSGDDEAEEEGAQEFALEAHLRDFLAKNPETIEPGLRLYKSRERAGVEFAVDGGRIDVLAVDRSDRLVVVELKLNRGRSKALGQLLHYMGWVDKHLGRGQPCRGIIIASEIPEELVLAVHRSPGVSLLRYKLSVSVEPVHRSE